MGPARRSRTCPPRGTGISTAACDPRFIADGDPQPTVRGVRRLLDPRHRRLAIRDLTRHGVLRRAGDDIDGPAERKGARSQRPHGPKEPRSASHRADQGGAAPAAGGEQMMPNHGEDENEKLLWVVELIALILSEAGIPRDARQGCSPTCSPTTPTATPPPRSRKGLRVSPAAISGAGALSHRDADAAGPRARTRQEGGALPRA